MTPWIRIVLAVPVAGLFLWLGLKWLRHPEDLEKFGLNFHGARYSHLVSRTLPWFLAALGGLVLILMILLALGALEIIDIEIG